MFWVTVSCVALLVFLPIRDLLGQFVIVLSKLVSGPRAGVLTFVLVEFLLNVLLFVPVFLLASLLWPRIPSWFLGLSALAATLCIEAIQRVALPRESSLSDVVANTLGGVIGIAIARSVQRRRRRSSGA